MSPVRPIILKILEEGEKSTLEIAAQLRQRTGVDRPNRTVFSLLSSMYKDGMVDKTGKISLPGHTAAITMWVAKTD